METILRVPGANFPLDALGRAYQQATTFLRYNRVEKTMERQLLKFDLLRREADAGVLMGGAFPDGFVSILRM